MSVINYCTCGFATKEFDGGNKKKCISCKKVYRRKTIVDDDGNSVSDGRWIEEDELEWFKELIRKYHPTTDSLLEFLYKTEWPNNLQYEAIEFVESNKSDPVKLWTSCRTWIKICYAVSLLTEYKETGNIILRHPSGAIIIDLKYFKGTQITK
ncbi:MAG: hypothetical protein WC523_04200 [Patescibacteria group bacterium]